MFSSSNLAITSALFSISWKVGKRSYLTSRVFSSRKSKLIFGRVWSSLSHIKLTRVVASPCQSPPWSARNQYWTHRRWTAFPLQKTRSTSHYPGISEIGWIWRLAILILVSRSIDHPSFRIPPPASSLFRSVEWSSFPVIVLVRGQVQFLKFAAFVHPLLDVVLDNVKGKDIVLFDDAWHGLFGIDVF